MFRARQRSSSRPCSATAALLHQQLGRHVRRQRKDRETGVEGGLSALRRRLSGRRRAHRLRVVHEPSALEQQGEARPPRGRGVAFATASGRSAGAPGSGRPSRRRSSQTGASMSATGAGASTRSTRDGPGALDVPGQGRIKGAIASREPALRRHLRRRPLCDRASTGNVIWWTRSQDRSAAAASSTRRRRSPTAASTSARPTARSTPRCREREAALVAGHGRLRLRLAGGLAEDRRRGLLQRPLLRARRGDR